MKIAFLSYSHLGINDMMPGGGRVTNELIKRVLEDAGHQVDFIRYRYGGLPGKTKVASLLNRLAVVHAWRNAKYVNAVTSVYDVLICDSSVCHRIKHPRCINLFHFIIRGYLDYGCVWPPSLFKRLKFSLLAVLEKAEAKGKFNIAVSEFSKDILENQGISVYKIIANAVDTEKFVPAGEATYPENCLYVGSYFYHGKGLDLLEKLAVRGLKIDCICDHDIGLHGGLNYLGTVEHYRLPEIYNQYGIVLYPSRFETSGLVPLEAMACGVPVIISNVGVSSEIRRVIPEFVVDGHDDAAVAEYQRRLELIQGNYEDYSHKAREFVVKFYAYDRFKAEWLALVDEIYAEKGKKA